MSGEDEEREEREGSHSLHRLVMKALVEKRDAERGPSAHWRPLSTAAADDEAALQRQRQNGGKCKVHVC